MPYEEPVIEAELPGLAPLMKLLPRARRGTKTVIRVSLSDALELLPLLDSVGKGYYRFTGSEPPCASQALASLASWSSSCKLRGSRLVCPGGFIECRGGVCRGAWGPLYPSTLTHVIRVFWEAATLCRGTTSPTRGEV